MNSCLFLLQPYFRISILVYFTPKKYSLTPKLRFFSLLFLSTRYQWCTERLIFNFYCPLKRFSLTTQIAQNCKVLPSISVLFISGQNPFVPLHFRRSCRRYCALTTCIVLPLTKSFPGFFALTTQTLSHTPTAVQYISKILQYVKEPNNIQSKWRALPIGTCKA